MTRKKHILYSYKCLYDIINDGPNIARVQVNYFENMQMLQNYDSTKGPRHINRMSLYHTTQYQYIHTHDVLKYFYLSHKYFPVDTFQNYYKFYDIALCRHASYFVTNLL